MNEVCKECKRFFEEVDGSICFGLVEEDTNECVDYQPVEWQPDKVYQAGYAYASGYHD